MDKDGKVISFINMKGGVCKTTLCFNLAANLAKNNKRVLLIDVDPQSNLTQSYAQRFSNVTDEDIEKGNIEFLIGEYSNDELVEFLNKKLITNDNISIIPGTLKTIFLERSSNDRTAQRLLKFIKESKVKSSYDYIFIDCPPTYSIYTQMAIFVSDFYIVPTIPDKFSILGVDLLERVIHDIIEANKYGVFSSGRYPKNLGIIWTRVDKNKRKQQQFQDMLISSQTVQEKDIYIFNNVFEESNKVSTFELGKVIEDTQDTKLLGIIDGISSEFAERVSRLSEE